MNNRRLALADSHTFLKSGLRVLESTPALEKGVPAVAPHENTIETATQIDWLSLLRQFFLAAKIGA